jgi:NAD(P)-dependent dehydrogenase (short-subunit alcohol dehydrogenase family)
VSAVVTGTDGAPNLSAQEAMTAHWTEQDIGDLNGKVAVVTGANSGIGLETARALAGHGATVVLACRSEAKANAAADEIRNSVPTADLHVLRLDLSDLEQIETFAENFLGRFDRLDLLINNAGVMMPPPSKTQQGYELQFGVNHLGHFALTGRLLPRLLSTPGARVVNVSSLAHRNGKIAFDDLDWTSRSYNRLASYGQSKLANLLFTFELERRLADAGVDVIATAAHPGWTATNLQQHTPLFRWLNPLLAMDPAQGALPTLRAAVDPDAGSGDYYGPHGFMEARGFPKKVGTTRAARDAAVAEKLWNVSVKRTGVDYAALDQPRAKAS